MNWSIHHVNIQAKDVRRTAAFYTSILGMAEGQWVLPETAGYVPVSPDRLALFDDPSRDGQAQGLHIIKPDPEFAARNNLIHNPSVGGHFAIQVKDMNVVIERLKAANVPYSDAGQFAIPGLWNIYFTDPEGNLIEVNQKV
ncbi:MAG: VOC family protein [Pseudomonadota bacterium]